jgi:hypothetical protein
VLLALIATAEPALADQEQLHALRITVENGDRYLVRGPDAIGGVGDWALGNGTLCAVVSDIAHESILSSRGGLLVDLGHCDRGDDQFHVLQPMLNVSREQVPPIQEVTAQRSEDEAQITTQGAFDGLVFTTRYLLGLQDPEVLRIRTELRRVAEGVRVRVLGDVTLHGNGSLSPFTASTRRPEHSVGFRHPQVNPERPLEMVRAIIPADLHVLVGSDALEPGVAYGLRLGDAWLRRANGEREPLPFLSINGVDFTMLGVLSAPTWVGREGEMGLLELVQALFMDLAVGDGLIYEREIRVGERADVASVSDQLWPRAPLVRGQLDDPGARIHIDRKDGVPVTEVRPRPDGRFSCRLPPAEYRARVIAPGSRTRTHEFQVRDGEVDLGRLALAEPSRVRLPRGGPMRLVFQGEGPTPDPRFGDELLGFRVGEQEVPTGLLSNQISLAGLADDPEEIALAPGSYRVYATRGPEYQITRATLDLGPGERVALEIDEPVRALATPGWISADLHIHAVPSDDSNLPLRTRVATLVAQGLEVAVSTEHDQIADYEPLIRRLGLRGLVASVVGVEITTTARHRALPHTSGHLNALPVPLRAERYRDGAPNGEGLRVREIANAIRSLGGERLLQMNHPRGAGLEDDDENYFSHLSLAGEPFDPTGPLESEPNRVMLEKDQASGLRDLDFDAVELLNGPPMRSYYRTRADWYSLLLQGEFRTGTANSDSHRAGEVVGLPRNYVRVPDERLDPFDRASFIRALREGHVYGTTGPLLDLQLGGAGPGDLHRGSSGTLRIGVDAAPWVPVSTCRVYLNAVLVRELPVRAGQSLELPLDFQGDAFVTVEVEGEPSPVFEALNPGARPFAFANPIFVDADGDGVWTPPGLPESLPATIRDPLRDLKD